jgi:hypothetical protein
MDGALVDPQWTPVIPGTTGGPVAQAPFIENRIDGFKMLNRNGILYVGIAGTEIDGVAQSENNRILLFIDSKPGGFNSLASWSIRSGVPMNTNGIMNLNGGIVFDGGFEADYILAINRANLAGETYYDLYDMTANTNVFLGQSPSNGYGFQENAFDGDLTKGFEFSLRLDAIGNPTNLQLFGILINNPNSNQASLVSNQFITVANAADNNYGDGSIFFSAAAPNPLVYRVAEDCYEEKCATLLPATVPLFTQPTPICVGQTAPVLPNASSDSPPITGTWNGPVSNQVSGTYTFTPGLGQCATQTTLNVQVNPVPITFGIFHD